MMTTENIQISKEVLETMEKDIDISINEAIDKTKKMQKEREQLQRDLLKYQEERLDIIRKQVEIIEKELAMRDTLQNMVANQSKMEDNKTLLTE